jgi:tetraacyldisaccharide 4'-kinase
VRFGDEPVLIARATKVDVWVGSDRFEAGKIAEEQRRTQRTLRKNAEGAEGFGEGARGLHLLDDGFQHRRLARDFDVVLVTAEDLDDVLLPAGNLREGFGALKRADAIVIRQEEWTAIAPRVRGLRREGAAMWSVERRLRFPAPLGVLSAGLRPVAFCAIARPEGFQAMLQDAGCGVIETIAYGDHHAYAAGDIQHIVTIAKGLNASGLLTTEKDAVKLSAAMRERLETVGPLVVVALEAEFLNTAEVLSDLEARLP